MDPIDRIAADIAAKGLARAAELEAKAARMRMLIADPALLRARAEARLRAEQRRFAWEREEDLPPDAPRSLWAARTFDGATGEGLTTYYYATYARSEGELRRKFARRVDAHLVEAAQLSDHLRGYIERRWGGGERPAGFSIFIERHINYS